MQSSCMYHNIHSKANVNYLLPTCARTAYQDIVYSIYKFENKFHAIHNYIELLACIEQKLI